MDEKYLMKNVMKAVPLQASDSKDSYLKIWERSTGMKAGKCAHEICSNSATIGAIAKKAFSSDSSLYIYPSCPTCARRTEMLYISDPLVILNV